MSYYIKRNVFLVLFTKYLRTQYRCRCLNFSFIEDLIDGALLQPLLAARFMVRMCLVERLKFIQEIL